MSTITNIQMLLNDQGVFWPLQRIYDALNEAQWDSWIRTKWDLTSTILTLNANDDIISIPSTIVVPKFVEDNGVKYFPSTQRELEAFHRTWRLDSPAQPMVFIVWDATHLRIYPRPDQTYTSYKLWGIGYPVEINGSNTSLVGDNTLQRAIEHLALGILFDATRPDLADWNRSIGEKQLQQFKKNLRQYQSHNTRRLRPGGRFDLQESGVIRELPVYYPVEC